MSEQTPSNPSPAAQRIDREADTAQQSLADALRVSFWLLTVLMVALAVWYVFISGWFTVDENQRAVRLRFGKIVGEGEQRVYEPGLHFGLPFPIEDKQFITTAPQKLNLGGAFWFEIEDHERGRSLDEMGAGPLNPTRDGSLVTGDANIVHGSFEITYEITDPVEYIENVGDVALAERLVRQTTERGVIHAVAQVEADELIAGRWGRDIAENRIQSMLDELGAGITVKNLSATTEMPLSVRAAYRAVSNAESEKGQKIDEARQAYSRTLVETAGEAHDELYDLIQAYERATAVGDEAQAEQLRGELAEAYTTLRLSDVRGGVPIGGEVATIINRAQTERRQIVQTVKGDASRFSQLLEKYRQSPRITVNRLWEDARENVLTSPDIETIYSPPEGLYIETNRDPSLEREREQERLRQQQEDLRSEAGL